jgi:two-component system cell cycle sensor histidine kinase/response regulator CckA
VTAPAQSSGKTERILIVEDEPRVRALVRRLLEGLGYRVLEAANGAEALGILETSMVHIDLILTDVVMPDVHGHDLAEYVTAHEPWRRVLYMSGYSSDEMLSRGLTRPGAAFLQKPFTREALARAVRETLDG